MNQVCHICMGYMLTATDPITHQQHKYLKCPTCGFTKFSNGDSLNAIDWTNPKCQVTEHFTVEDACMLHQWNRLATAGDGMDTDKLVTLCKLLEKIRTFLGCPMNVHCMFRSRDYNKLIGALEHDVHSMSIAVDFDCNGSLTIQEVKDKLEPVLEQFGVRMERGTTTWVHLDTHPVGNARYFFT